MDRSAKRRRVSTTRSISVSPVKIATDHDLSAPSLSPSRPSYMSPTIASLSRTNPDLVLIPNRSFGLDGADEDIFDPANIKTLKRLTPQKRKLNPTPLRTSTPNRGSPTSAGRLGLEGQDVEAGSRRTTTGKGKRVSFANDEGLTLNPSALEQENLVNGEELTARASPGTDDELGEAQTNPLDIGDDGEPELPKLPTPDTPFGPPGIMSSSPSGQAARRLTTRRSMLPPASQRQSAVPRISELERQEKSIEPDEEDHSGDENEQDVTMTNELDEDFETPDVQPLEDLIPLKPSGPIVTYDTKVDTKQMELEKLLRQKRRLEDEVRQLENLWARSGGQSRTQSKRLSRIDNRDMLAAVLGSSSRGGAPLSKVRVPVSQRLRHLLPFHIPSATTPVSNQQASEKVTQSDLTQKKPGTGLLSAFDPLTVKGEQTIVIDEDKHLIRHTLSITSPDELLHLGFTVDMDPSTSQICQIQRQGTWPSWLEPEFGSFSKQHIGEPSSKSTLDINALGTGASNYWALAGLRASIWQACIQDHTDLVVGIPDAQAADGEEDGQRVLERLHLGRQALRLERAGVGLLVTWQLCFSATGEVNSNVSACAAFSASWREREDAEAWDHVGELFDLFLRRFGVRAAVMKTVELMFGSAD